MGAEMKEAVVIHLKRDLLLRLAQKAVEKRTDISSLVELVMSKHFLYDSSVKSDNNGGRDPNQSLDDFLKNIERDEITKALELTNTKTAAAEILGISFRSFRHRLRILGID